VKGQGRLPQRTRRRLR